MFLKDFAHLLLWRLGEQKVGKNAIVSIKSELLLVVCLAVFGELLGGMTLKTAFFIQKFISINM